MEDGPRRAGRGAAYPRARRRGGARARARARGTRARALPRPPRGPAARRPRSASRPTCSPFSPSAVPRRSAGGDDEGAGRLDAHAVDVLLQLVPARGAAAVGDGRPVCRPARALAAHARALGLTSTPEKPEPTRSDTHAWAAHPNYGLLATVLGVRPASRGFRTVVVAPALGPLRRAEGRVPHPRGDIDVALERVGAKGIRAKITPPRGSDRKRLRMERDARRHARASWPRAGASAMSISARSNSQVETQRLRKERLSAGVATRRGGSVEGRGRRDRGTASRRARAGLRASSANARPHTWWHWMNGNVLRPGDHPRPRSDGARPASAACRCSTSARASPRGPVATLSPEWVRLVEHAAAECNRLGLSFTMHNCPGWSSSGGPWVTPDRAMLSSSCGARRWSKAAGACKVALPKPFAKIGYYKDAVRPRLSVAAWRGPSVQGPDRARDGQLEARHWRAHHDQQRARLPPRAGPMPR
jgi:hypothetical protein